MAINKRKVGGGLSEIIQADGNNQEYCHPNCFHLQETEPDEKIKFICTLFAQSNVDEAILLKEPMRRRKGCMQACGLA